jgi:hypothetical protein
MLRKEPLAKPPVGKTRRYVERKVKMKTGEVVWREPAQHILVVLTLLNFLVLFPER